MSDRLGDRLVDAIGAGSCMLASTGRLSVSMAFTKGEAGVDEDADDGVQASKEPDELPESRSESIGLMLDSKYSDRTMPESARWQDIIAVFVC